MDPSPELEFETPTREEEMARLARFLRLARGFRLYFARSLPGEPRRGLLSELSERFEGVRVFDVPKDVDHLRSALENWLAGQPEPPRAICVTGIETWVPAGDVGAATAFVRNLNASRDLFAQVLPCPMVLWGADHILRAIQHGAPDFFSVASGIVLFPDDLPAPRRQEGSGLSLEGSARWLLELEELEKRLAELGPGWEGTVQVDRIASLDRKVDLLLKLGRYAEAEPIALLAYNEAHRVLGFEHPDTLWGANNLALVYRATGRQTEAESLHASNLEVRRRVLGDDHPDTLRTANNLAALYRATGRYAESEELYGATLKTRRRVLGPEHPDTLTSANNLAGLYWAMRRYTEAEPLYVETLETLRRTLGDEHPDTLLSAHNLASLYQSTGRYAEAEKLYETTIKAYRSTLGDDHPDTLRSLNNLASLYRVTGRPRKALALIETLLASSRRLPEDHEVRHAVEIKHRQWSIEESGAPSS